MTYQRFLLGYSGNDWPGAERGSVYHANREELFVQQRRIRMMIRAHPIFFSTRAIFFTGTHALLFNKQSDRQLLQKELHI
jgi:hypothetical protein